MTDSEAAEVTSSTDVGLAEPSSDDVTSSQQEMLPEGITSTNVLLQAADGQEVPDNMVAFTGDQQVAMSTVMDSLGQDEGYTIINADQSFGVGGGHFILTSDGTMLSTDGQPVSMTHPASLQGLLASQGMTSQLTTASGETIQIITVANPAELAGQKQLWQMVPEMGNNEIGAIIINQQEDGANENDSQEEGMDTGDSASSTTQVVDMVPVSSMPGAVAEILMPPPISHPLPPGCPAWAARLKDCQKIGDAFRGWVESEVELDLLLTYHKQQTSSFWGTRQSPSPAKQSTRLMWKSQYVPFDGIPFINSGSRAIVMECQYGPRRKGAQAKRSTPDVIVPQEFKQTCPARIYIKKVRKFPEFAVDMNLDKKTLKIAMDKSFQLLKERGMEAFGQERFYVQLPTEASHEFHSEMHDVSEPEHAPRRLHPRVSEKIRDIVASGESRLYAVRKALRRFVERELFDCPENVPEKHNLTFYPTVNDLQNHIHQALRDIISGTLPTTAQHVRPGLQQVEIRVEGMGYQSSGDESSAEFRLDGGAGDGSPHAETVTVTLTQNPGEDGQHIISRVETHLSDGSTQVSTSLTPETAQLLAKLHPNMFPAGSLLQLQEAPGSNEVPISQSPNSKVQTVTLLARPPSETAQADIVHPPSSPESLYQADTGPTTLQIVQHGVEDQGGDLVPQTLQGIHILDGSSLNMQALQLMQQSGSLPPGLQFISADGELSDANGQPLHIISGVTALGQQDDGTDITHGISDVETGLDEQGVITIAMAPDIIKSEEMDPDEEPGDVPEEL